MFLNIESGRAQVQFAVGFKLEGKTGLVVDAEDALGRRPQSQDPAPGGADRLCPPAKQARDASISAPEGCLPRA